LNENTEYRLRILTWNVNHRTRKKAIPAVLTEGILSLNPDVIVLTEYVEGPDHSNLCNSLKGGGLAVQFHSQAGRHNQVFIASRFAATVGSLAPPTDLYHAVPNWLHVRLAGPLLDIFGMRVPCYKLAIQRRSYWDWFETAVQPLFPRPAVIIGDINCDPRSLTGHGPKHLKRLATAGWHLPEPTGDASYISYKGKHSRLDHALATPAVNVRSASYIDSANGFFFMGSGRGFLSDHAPLVLDIVLPKVELG